VCVVSIIACCQTGCKSTVKQLQCSAAKAGPDLRGWANWAVAQGPPQKTVKQLLPEIYKFILCIQI